MSLTAITTETALVRKRRALAVGLAALVTLPVYFVLSTVLGQHLAVPSGSAGSLQDLNPVFALAIALVASLAGWALLALLERFAAAKAKAIWSAVAFVVTFLSLSGPFTASGLSGSQRISLVLFHIAVAALLIPMMRSTARDNDRNEVTR